MLYKTLLSSLKINSYLPSVLQKSPTSESKSPNFGVPQLWGSKHDIFTSARSTTFLAPVLPLFSLTLPCHYPHKQPSICRSVGHRPCLLAFHYTWIWLMKFNFLAGDLCSDSQFGHERRRAEGGCTALMQGDHYSPILINIYINVIINVVNSNSDLWK